MKKYLSRVLFFISTIAAMAPMAAAQDKELRELASNLAGQIEKQGRSPVAITSFINSDYGPDFSVFLVDRLNILLASGGNQFEVVTRDHIKEAFREINLALGQNYDADTFAKIGKAVGARSLIRGGFTVFASGVRVSVTAEIIDVETGRIIGGSFVDIPYTGDVKAMLSPLAAKNSTLVGVVGGIADNAEAIGAATPPSFQNSVIRATVEQLAVNDKRAVLNVVIENTTKALLLLGIEKSGINSPPSLALSDDRASDWVNPSVTGLQKVFPPPTTLGGAGPPPQPPSSKDEYTVIGPSQRVSVIVTFQRNGPQVDPTATSFGFSAELLSYTSSGPQKTSVGITAIKPK